MDFLAITDVGKTAGPLVAEAGAEEAGSEASEWENREREEHLAQMAEEEARLGGGALFTYDLGWGPRSGLQRYHADPSVKAVKSSCIYCRIHRPDIGKLQLVSSGGLNNRREPGRERNSRVRPRTRP